MWRNELLGRRLRSPSAFLVIYATILSAGCEAAIPVMAAVAVC